MAKELKEIKEQTKEIVKFDVENAIIVALDAKYTDVQITDTKSYAVVMAGLAEYREIRLTVGEGHKEEKDDALKHCQFLDAEKRRILGRLAPGEDRLKAIRQAYDDEIARVEAEKDRLEEERKENIRAKIFKIQESAMPTVLGTMALENLRELSSRLEDMEIKETEYMEYTEQATKIIEDSYNAVQDAITARSQLDKEAEDRRIESARLEKIRLDQEAAQKLINEAAARHQAKIDTDNLKIRLAQKKIDDDKAELAAEKQADADRKEREEFERQAKIKAEKEAKEAQEQIERDKSAKATAQAAEKARQEALAPDMDKLTKWIESFNETAIPSPQLKSKEAKEIYRIAREQIETILQNAMETIEKL